MSYAKHACPNCGAPLPPPPPTGVVRCGFCAIPLAPGPGGWKPAAPPPQDEELRDPDRTRLWFDGARYAILGRLARGEGSDVFLARRDGRLSELVVLKVLRVKRDADLLAREHEVLEALDNSTAQGTPHFARLIPQRVGHGIARLGMRGEDGERNVALHRWRSGFVHTFNDVLRAYPGGIAPESSVWIWKRTLELLGWIHRSGWVHGAVLPPHLLVHARDHGVTLVGFSRAVRLGHPLPAFSKTLRAHYPDEVWSGGAASVTTDVTMSARSVLLLLGGDLLNAPRSAPAPLARMLESFAQGETAADAWEVRDRLDAVAGQVFGRPKFIPFVMPGWM